MGGYKFTYYQNAGAKLSKLDRIHVCPEFVSNFPQASCIALPREQSDHSPILLELSSFDFGPIPFRLFNLWILRPRFNEVILRAILELSGYGAPDLYFLNKLNFLKNRIRSWRSMEHPKEVIEIEKTKGRLIALDKKAEMKGLLGSEIKEWVGLSSKLSELEKMVSMDLRQKLRLNWLTDGDENTKFFHGFVNNRNRKNNINGLLVNGQ